MIEEFDGPFLFDKKALSVSYYAYDAHCFSFCDFM